MSIFDSLTMKEARFARHCSAAIELADAEEKEAAAARLRKAEQILKPTDTQWICEVGKIYAHYLNQSTEAQRVLKPLVEAKNPQGLMEASLAYVDSNDYEAAIKLLTIAVQLPSVHTNEAPELLGLAYLKTEQYEDSARWYKSTSAAGDPIDLGLAVATALLALDHPESTDLSSADLAEIQRLAAVGRIITSERANTPPLQQLIGVDVGLNVWRDRAELWLTNTVPLADLHSIMLGLYGAADFYLVNQKWDNVQAEFARVQTIAAYIRRHLPASGERRELLIAGCVTALAAAGSVALLLDKWETWKESMDEARRFEALSEGRHPLVIRALAAAAASRISGVHLAIYSGATTLFDIDEVWKADFPHLDAAVEAIDLSDTEHNPRLAKHCANLLASQIVVTSQRKQLTDDALDALTTAVQRLTQQIVYCEAKEAEEFKKPLHLAAQLVEQNRPGTGQRLKSDGKPWPI